MSRRNRKKVITQDKISTDKKKNDDYDVIYYIHDVNKNKITPFYLKLDDIEDNMNEPESSNHESEPEPETEYESELVIEPEPESGTYDRLVKTVVTHITGKRDNDILDYLKYGYYINLKERVDRRQSVIDAFKKLNIPSLNVLRIDARKHNYGAIGCYLSHIYCLYKAREFGYDHILICEDDIQFKNIDVLKTQLRRVLTNIKKWDVIMLASNVLSAEKILGVNYCVRVTNGMAATCYIVKSHYYDTLLNNFREGINHLFKHPELANLYAIDVYWNILQKKDNWIIPLPLSVTQYPNYSNIEKRHVNYDKCMLKKIIL